MSNQKIQRVPQPIQSTSAPQTKGRDHHIHPLSHLRLVPDTTGYVTWDLLLFEDRKLAIYHIIKWHIIHLVRDNLFGSSERIKRLKGPGIQRTHLLIETRVPEFYRLLWGRGGICYLANTRAIERVPNA